MEWVHSHFHPVTLNIWVSFLLVFAVHRSVLFRPYLLFSSWSCDSIVDQSPQAVWEQIPNWVSILNPRLLCHILTCWFDQSFRIELITSFLCDVMISGSLIYYFYVNLGVSKRCVYLLLDICYLFLFYHQNGNHLTEVNFVVNQSRCIARVSLLYGLDATSNHIPSE